MSEIPPEITKMFDNLEGRMSKKVKIEFDLALEQALEVIKFVEELTKR